MKPLSEHERLCAALKIARSLHEEPERRDRYPSGTSITPVGIEDGSLYVAVKLPREATNTEMERVDVSSMVRPTKRAAKKQRAIA
jgi:hypothetical protein